ncbi:tetratricopeptide repeat protein [Nonomuraea sp. NN258]|uniref:tetratricopeptide repeat protein n=1 Tax=Nonomuraea antri TaxID=2730852 RepID=UPI001568490D|nr:tetratricopeptide repeat protein [Nonomuraea antri]NRQ32899.1 tetratricopeptide repeat protein [Nonomuraea antri]
MADFSRPGSLYGAVDLGARKQALEAQARREAAGPEVASSVVDVTEETFTSDVVDRSMTTPVIIDFWSPRAPGSAQLSPVLEKVVGDLGGRVVLAKVNVDVSPQIAQALRVQAVPTVLAIFQGQVMAGFQQVVPEQELRRWLDELLAAVEQFYQANPDARPPAAGEEQGEVPAGPPADPDLAAAVAAIDEGDLDAAAEAYQRLLARLPGDEEAKMGLAGVNLIRRTMTADPADVQRRLEDPADIDAQLLAADLEMASGSYDEAFSRIIAVVKRTSGDDRDKARRHLLGLFDALPGDDPSLAKARRALSSALF